MREGRKRKMGWVSSAASTRTQTGVGRRQHRSGRLDLVHRGETRLGYASLARNRRLRTKPPPLLARGKKPGIVTFVIFVGDLAHRPSVVALTRMGHRGGTKSPVWHRVSGIAFLLLANSCKNRASILSGLVIC